MLQEEVFSKVVNAWKHILVVTKYWDKEITQNILKECEEQYSWVFFGLGENRIGHIQDKQISREQMHFIGNIQSRKIADIVKNCAVIHSLASLKHAKKIDEQWMSTRTFIQIRLDSQKDIGIAEWELKDFLDVCWDFKNLKIIGISGMGSWDFSEQEKRDEFRKLVSLRDTYIPWWLISAGTSRDYEIALEEWIDVVRIWTKSVTCN